MEMHINKWVIASWKRTLWIRWRTSRWNSCVNTSTNSRTSESLAIYNYY